MKEEAGMEISRKESRPAGRGPAETFTGEVSVKPLFDTNDARTFSSAEVSFTPCARTAWHTHPGGQTLIVTAGTGWVQEWGGDKHRIAEGDVIWTPPGVKHWHGAHRRHRDDPHRHPSLRRRPPRRLARTRHRRPVPRLGVRADAHRTPAHGSDQGPTAASGDGDGGGDAHRDGRLQHPDDTHHDIGNRSAQSMPSHQ